MNIRSLATLLIVLVTCLSPTPSSADSFYCEVMGITGSVSVSSGTTSRNLQEGDMLNVGDTVITGADGKVDLAFDNKWKNISRITSNSEVTISSLSPTSLKLATGKVFAKLDALPNNESFEVRTPIAIAAVRGSCYTTSHSGGNTTVTNNCSTPVTVNVLDKDGNIIETYILDEGESITINKDGPQVQVVPPDQTASFPDGRSGSPTDPCPPSCPGGDTGDSGPPTSTEFFNIKQLRSTNQNTQQI